jgi:hypothetical protein
VARIASVERGPAILEDALDATKEDVDGLEEREAAVAVVVGVPLEELGEPAAGASDIAEATG